MSIRTAWSGTFTDGSHGVTPSPTYAITRPSELRRSEPSGHVACEVEAVKAAHLNHELELLQKDIDQKSVSLTAVHYFAFKGRACEGHAIHVAALHPDGTSAVEQLLALNADVSDECTFPSYRGLDGTAQPIHLAAASGSTANVKVLIDAKAHVDAPAKYDGEWYYDPIHEAAFFNNHRAIDLLLSHNVCVNIENRDGLTPIHVAVSQGSVRAVRTLLAHNADSQCTDTYGRTPLALAVEDDSFPYKHLHLLARKSMEDVLEIARRCPGATKDLLKDPQVVDVGEPSRVHPEWKSGLGDVTFNNWIKLMAMAPFAAEDVLEAVTQVPEVVDSRHHPVPRRARLHPGEIRCYYGPERTWEYSLHHRDGHTHPMWHDSLAPGKRVLARSKAGLKKDGKLKPSMRHAVTKSNLKMGTQPTVTAALNEDDNDGGDDWAEVGLKVLLVPDVLHAGVLYALSDTKHERIFSKPAVQALLQYVWVRLARRVYVLLLFYRVVVLLMLIQFVASPPQWESTRRFLWSASVAITSFETVCKLWEVHGYIKVLHRPRTFFGKYKNWVDISYLSLTHVMLWLAWGSFNLQDPNVPRVILAICQLIRWGTVLYTLRGFHVFGTRILPILSSLHSMGTMLVIAGFVFGAFYFAFVALDDKSQADHVLFECFRAMLAGDGDGIDELILLGGGSVKLAVKLLTVGALFVFGVSVLNLFIAVQTEAYDIAQDHGKAVFYKEQMKICLQVWLRIHWKWRPITRPWAVVVMITVATLSVSLGLLCLPHGGPGKHKWVPAVVSLLLLIGMLAVDCIFLQRPWEYIDDENDDEEEIRRPNYLWFCCTQDSLQAIARYHAEQADLQQFSGRMSMLRMESERRDHVIRAQLSGVHQQSQDNFDHLRLCLEQRCGHIDRHLQKVEDRLALLEKRSDEASAVNSRLDRMEVMMTRIMGCLDAKRDSANERRHEREHFHRDSESTGSKTVETAIASILAS